MNRKKDLKKNLLFINVTLVILSFIALIIEKEYDLRYGNGDGIILKWLVHSKLILFQFLSIVFLLGFLLLLSKTESLKNMGVMLFSAIIFIIILDLFFGLIIKFKSDSHRVNVEHYTNINNSKKRALANVFDKELGYKPSEKKLFANSYLINNQDSTVIYNVQYSVDDYNRRINPSNSDNQKDKRFALFFGGSFTFGSGVEDYETLPFHFVNQDTNYISYNYGFGGYGSNQMLANLKSPNFKEEILQKKGVCFYIYIDNHINRVNGFFNTFTKFGAFTPYYNIKNGEISNKVSFIEGRPILSYFYFLLDNSNTLEYFNINFPLKITNKHYELTASVIKESYTSYLQHFGQNDFYIVIYPGHSDKIIDYLKDTKIKVLNYKNLFESNDQFQIYPPYETHPNARAFELLSKKINEDIRFYSFEH